MKKILAFALTAMFASPLSAQTITGVTGTVDHGETITISGSSFGSKSTAAPLVWDDFEDGTNGNLVDPSYGGWTSRVAQGSDASVAGPQYSTTGGLYGSLGMKCDPFGYDSNAYTVSMDITDSFPVLYIDAWIKLVKGDGNKPRVTKPINAFEQPLQIDHELFWQAAPTCGYTDDNPPYTLQRYTCDGSDGGYGGWMTGLTDDELETWTHIQIEFVDALTSDGYYKIWYNGVLSATKNMSYTSGCTEDALEELWIGHYQDWDSLDSGCANPVACRLDVIYWDNVYVDNSIARVELGNNATYSSCTEREVQIASSWGTSSIAATVNTGAFQTGETAYLFVVDSDGTPSAGYAITIGDDGGGSYTALTAPTNLQVNGGN